MQRFNFHHQPSSMHVEDQNFPFSKCFLSHGYTAMRNRLFADSKNICTAILMAHVLVISTVLATRCQGFCRHSFTWICKSWALPSCHKLKHNRSSTAQPIIIVEIWSFANRHTCDLFFRPSAQYPINGAIYCSLAPVLLWFYSVLCLFFVVLFCFTSVNNNKMQQFDNPF